MHTVKATHNETEVLFQKLGNTWYAMAEVENDFIYSALPEGLDPRETKLELFEVIEEHMQKVSDHYKREQETAA
jgi:hypothetical protein